MPLASGRGTGSQQRSAPYQRPLSNTRPPHHQNSVGMCCVQRVARSKSSCRSRQMPVASLVTAKPAARCTSHSENLIVLRVFPIFSSHIAPGMRHFRTLVTCTVPRRGALQSGILPRRRVPAVRSASCASACGCCCTPPCTAAVTALALLRCSTFAAAHTLQLLHSERGHARPPLFNIRPRVSGGGGGGGGRYSPLARHPPEKKRLN